MNLYWVMMEHYDSGECYTYRWFKYLVQAASPERACQLVLAEDHYREDHFGGPLADEFEVPDTEGVLSG